MLSKYFIAIDLPKNIKTKLYEKTNQIIEKYSLKSISKENYHITIYYIGLETKQQAIKIFNLIKTQNTFEIILKEIGCFHNNVIWLGIKNKQGLIDLNKQITNSNKYTPHITLCRTKTLDQNKFHKFLQELKDLNLKFSFIAKEIILYESVIENNKRIYKKIEKHLF